MAASKTYSLKGQDFPAGHDVHWVAPPTEYVPAGHANWAVESDVFGHAEPGGQSMQSVAATSLNVPKVKRMGDSFN